MKSDNSSYNKINKEIEKLDTCIGHIKCELLVATNRIATIEHYKDSIWLDGYDEMMSLAKTEYNQLTMLKQALESYLERYLMGDNQSFTSSPELQRYGIEATSIIKKEDEEPTSATCYKQEDELELNYREAKKKIDNYKRQNLYSSIELEALESILFFTYLIFQENLEKVPEAKKKRL